MNIVFTINLHCAGFVRQSCRASQKLVRVWCSQQRERLGYSLEHPAQCNPHTSTPELCSPVRLLGRLLAKHPCDIYDAATVHKRHSKLLAAAALRFRNMRCNDPFVNLCQNSLTLLLYSSSEEMKYISLFLFNRLQSF